VAETGERLVRPWVRAFCEDRCLPAAVRGPVESIAFARLVRVRAAGVRGWGLGIGVGIGFVILETSNVVLA
jgi:hypothetical protein